jgi:hypothetical protein
MAHHNLQIPPDLVVKSQAIDITEIILSRIRRPNAVQTLCRNRISRFEQLSTSEAHWSTTKSDGMWSVYEVTTILDGGGLWSCGHFALVGMGVVAFTRLLHGSQIWLRDLQGYFQKTHKPSLIPFHLFCYFPS